MEPNEKVNNGIFPENAVNEHQMGNPEISPYYLVINREEKPAGGLVKWLVYYDDFPKGYIANGQNVAIPTEKGSHLISFEIAGNRQGPFGINVPPDTHYLIRFDIKAYKGLKLVEQYAITQKTVDNLAPDKLDLALDPQQFKKKKDAEKTLSTFSFLAGAQLLLAAFQPMLSSNVSSIADPNPLLIVFGFVFIGGGLFSRLGIATPLWAVLIILLAIADIISRIVVINQGAGTLGIFIIIGFLIDLGAIGSGLIVLGQKAQKAVKAPES